MQITKEKQEDEKYNGRSQMELITEQGNWADVKLPITSCWTQVSSLNQTNK